MPSLPATSGRSLSAFVYVIQGCTVVYRRTVDPLPEIPFEIDIVDDEDLFDTEVAVCATSIIVTGIIVFSRRHRRNLIGVH
jgi:hypothetical protein